MKKSLYTPEQQKLQEKLKEARRLANLTQSQLAQVLGKPQSFVAKYEAGERRLDLIELIYVLRALNVIPSEFIRSFIDCPR